MFKQKQQKRKSQLFTDYHNRERFEQQRAEFDMKKYDDLMRCEGQSTFVYVLLVTPSYEEKYYKIGYTSNSTYVRFVNETEMPSYVMLLSSTHMPLKDAQQLEKMLHDAFHMKSHKPLAKFGGHTECFKLNESDLEWVKRVFQAIT